VVIGIYTGKAPEGALSQPEKNHQVRHQYLLTVPIHIFVECEDILAQYHALPLTHCSIFDYEHTVATHCQVCGPIQ
jgi:hypothetical protein